MNRNYVARQTYNPSASVAGMPAKFRAAECRDNTTSAEAGRLLKRRPIRSRVIVSVSADAEFDRHLRLAAMERGMITIRVDSLDAAFRIIHADCCGVVLLDLDSVGRAGWEKAGELMQDDKCPPVILLTGTGEQFDLRMTVFAGSIFEKSSETSAVLNVAEEILNGPPPDSPEEGGRPGAHYIKELFRSGATGSQSPVRRYWGINE